MVGMIPMKHEDILERALEFLDRHKMPDNLYVYNIKIDFGTVIFKRQLDFAEASLFYDRDRQIYLHEYYSTVVLDLEIISEDSYNRTRNILENIQGMILKGAIDIKRMVVDMSIPKPIYDPEVYRQYRLKYTVNYGDTVSIEYN